MLPLALNELVKTSFHTTGGFRLVVPKSEYMALSWPLAALMVSVLPLMLKLVMTGLGAGPDATTKSSAPLLIMSEAAPTAPPPVTVTEDGAVPVINPPVLVVISV